MSVIRAAAALLAAAWLAGCGGLLKSEAPTPLIYRLQAPPLGAATQPVVATLLVALPSARSGLEGEHIVVTLPDHRQDVYAGGRWNAPLPQVVEALLLDGLRSAGGFQAVIRERSQFGGRYLLQTEIVEFAADYAAAGALPVVHVRLRGEVGLASSRRLLASVEGSAAVPAAADRRREVLAAFEAAYAAAAGELIAAVDAAALADERSAAPPAH